MFFTDPNQDICGKLKAWWQEVPAYTRFILYVSLVMFAASMVVPVVSFWIVLVPAVFLEKLYLWQVLTFEFQPFGIFGLLFTMFSYLPTACRTERRLGTVRYISFFLITNAILAVIYVGLARLGKETGISLLSMIYSMVPLCGLWPLIMVEMVIRCNKDPESLVGFMCFPIQLKNKYFPWVFFCIFLLLSGGMVLSLFVGIIVGYLRNFLFRSVEYYAVYLLV